MSYEVAVALESYLKASLAHGNGRQFYRIDGFEEDSYRFLLNSIAQKGDQLGSRPLWLRTIAPVTDAETYALEPGKSATWYRNHVPETHSLVLIFNQSTSDAQSLKDIHPITERILARETTHLADATFSRYQLNQQEIKVLDAFTKRIPKLGIPAPQLRDLVGFFQAIDNFMSINPGKQLNHAIAACLPEVNLFAARELSDSVNKRKGDDLLKIIYRSTLIGSNPLENSELVRHRERLEKADFTDESLHGGLDPEAKRELLKRFLSEVMDDRNDLRRVFAIDWSEVSFALYKQRKEPPSKGLKDLASALDQVIKDENIGELSQGAQEALSTLHTGEPLEDSAADDLYEELRSHLGKDALKRLNRLRRVTRRNTTEFAEGLVGLLVDLFERNDEDGEKLEVKVEYKGVSFPKKIDEGEKDAVFAEAVKTFQTLYRGIEGYFSSATFNFDGLWPALGFESGDITEKYRAVDLTFRVELINAKHETAAAADLVWNYVSNNLLALTTAHLSVEAELQASIPKLPIYNSVRSLNTTISINLSQPFETLGTWYEQPASVRDKLTEQLKPKALPQVWQKLSEGLSSLENAWRTFVTRAEASGLLTADLNTLLHTYENFLDESTSTLATDVEASNGFSIIGQAWLVGEQHFDDWAIVPLLHPLKLHWWVERLKTFSGFVQQLKLRGKEVVADEKEFKRSLGTLYSSSTYPAILSLQKEDLTAEYLLPVVEAYGYELYRPKHLAGLAFGLAEELMPTGEGGLAAKVASKELFKVLSDYLKTFPFAFDGLDIYLFKCRSSSLPGLLLDTLARADHSLPRVTIVVHVDDGGAPAYREVMKWLENREEFKGHEAGAYFPSVTLQVLECSSEAFFEKVSDVDLVILADVLAEQGQDIEPKLYAESVGRRPFEGYFRTHGGDTDPHSRGQQTRKITLNDGTEPSLVQNFYKIQWITKERRALKKEQAVSFVKHVTLQSWAKPLGELHKRFNWVACYDTSVDRFLLKATIPQAVEVIRYSVGLGPKKRHNLTVSSSDETQKTVVQRLGARLDAIVAMPHMTRQKLAGRLVEESKKISGDIVLRAAGPGMFLNELIGVVSAKHEAESLKQSASLKSWVYLDDFAHWFPKKFPDLLFFTLDMIEGGQLYINIDVIEAKCVDLNGFEGEALDARRQVVEGVSRLKRVWEPGAAHLDARYWYDQLYQSIVSNLSFEMQIRLPWNSIGQKVMAGDFTLEIAGKTFVFCHNGSPASITPGKPVDHDSFLASTLQDTKLTFSHYSKTGLLSVLGAVTGDSEAFVDSMVPEPVATSTTLQEAVTPTNENVSNDSIPLPTNNELSPAVGSSASDTSEGTRESVEEILPRWLIEQANDLSSAIKEYGIDIYPINATHADIGPNVVRHKVMLRPGERLTRIQGIAPDLVHRLALTSIPIIDNVLGTQYVGIDLANPAPETIRLLPLLKHLTQPGSGELPFILGQAPDGRLVIEDLSEFPHMLVAGATNSGKSVFLRSLIVSFMHLYTPDQLRLLIIDPKRTDFSFFEGLPFLNDGKVVTDRQQARDNLLSLVHEEMPQRQQLMQGRSMKIKDFNRRFPEEALPVIVAVIDEYAQLLSIMSSKESKAFEQDLMSLAAVARSTGIHLVLATQRPSADVVTGTLRANLPASVAFKVASSTNSRIVLDQGGAENLFGQGDLLFRRPSGDIVRLQAPFIDEVELFELVQRYR